MNLSSQNGSFSGSGSHIYYDAFIKNNSSSPLQCYFQEKRLSSYLRDPSKYYMTIVRFNLSTIEIPLMIPDVQIVNNTDPNLLTYSLTMSYKVSGNTISYQQYVIFVPENMMVSPPVPPFSLYTLDNEYYYLNSFQAFVDMLNTALVNCWNGLKSAVETAGGSLIGSSPNIYFEMDSTSGLMQLNADILQYDQVSLSNPILLSMNSQLYYLMNSFQTIEYGYNQPYGISNTFIIKNNNNSNLLNTSNVNYIVMFNEYSVAGLWTPFDSLICTTSAIPITKSLQTPPIIANDAGVESMTALSSNLDIYMVTDFQVTLDLGNEYRTGGSVQYTTQVYRLLDMTAAGAIDTLDLSFYWKSNKSGNVFPLYIDSGASSSIKLLFRAKELGV